MEWLIERGAFVFLLSAMCSAPIGAQEITPVESIRVDPSAHVNEIRTVEGVVDRLVNRGAGLTPSYYLEDDFGHQILVIPFEDPPARGSRVVARGVVNLDPSGDPVLTLFDAGDSPDVTPTGIPPADGSPTDISPADGSPVEAATEDGLTDGSNAAGESATGAQAEPARAPRRIPGGPWSPGRIAVVGLIALLVAYGGYRLGSTDDKPRPIITGPRKDDVDFATDALWPESEQEFDGRTMRFIRPDPTMQLMPARLEVVAGGDEGTEIPFVGVPGEDCEMMIGRAPGDGPSNVELKQKTVSRTHAVIRHRHGEWLIENLSMTNPTVLNDEILGVKERLLTDGDRIEMGEVVFVFKNS